jgi:curved DNA binding protein
LTLQEGDVVKIDLGVHIDGYIASVAHTVVATANKTEPATGRKADVICAAHVAAEAALRLLRPGNKNTQVTEAIATIAASFKCNPIEGVLSHQVKRFIIDGEKVIINKTTLDQKVDEFTFEEGEAYTVDIVMSTGEGKPKEVETKTTVFKRAPDAAYSLKLKASHYVMNEINKNFPALPFTLRAFIDEKRAKMGIVELIKHDLVHSYPVLFEKPGELIAQTKFTVLLLPSQISRITSHAAPYVKSELSVTDEKIKQILALGTKRTTDSKKAKKKKKKKAVAPALVPADADKPAAEAAAEAAAATTETK